MQNISLKTGWKGFLSFTFVNQKSKTVVKDKQHFGPLVLQRPYYQELNRPTVLVIHPPGGIVGGDQLEVIVRFGLEAKGLVSTPAATKFYRSQGQLAKQTQTIHVNEFAEVEWLPQETLFFDHSNVDNRLIICLDSPNNKLIAWDIVGLGRPARGEGFASGVLTQSLEFWIENELVFVDRLKLSQDSILLDSISGLNAHVLYASALFYCEDSTVQSDLLEKLQAMSSPVNFGVTKIKKLIVLRALATELDELKTLLFEAWKIARPDILKVPVVKPRIWNT
ncbi:Urease accessory protein UreD [Hydrogenovibrio crunogenus]|uniref:Urease accessory protein UreD n=1 Tax=Hydrogenovibrio crunogenus TaxID=39765 RepID=A0A4P7NXF8_9GAMM|nr:urease accessory protein UreD [Hydrogenovibrio crunogenus]QBZ82450.1 Urease accessory protein UreD [Hydrogenovibrio crunogenus]